MGHKGTYRVKVLIEKTIYATAEYGDDAEEMAKRSVLKEDKTAKIIEVRIAERSEK